MHTAENNKPAEDSRKTGFAWKLLFRLSISVVFLLIVYRLVDFEALFETLSKVSLLTACLLVVLYALGQAISAYKWRIFIQEVGIKRSIPETLKAYFLGMCANTFGLGTLGGDVSRGLMLRPEPGQRAPALATVVADRVHGLGILLGIGCLAIILVQPQSLGSNALPIAVAALASLALGWLAGPKILLRLFPKGHRFSEAAKDVSSAFPRRIRPFFIASCISVCFHTLQILMHLIIANELGAGISLSLLFATVPIVNVLSALPISTNGIGVREALYVYLFVPLGVSNEQAVAFGALWIITITSVSALSWVLLGMTFKLPGGTKESNNIEPKPGSDTQNASVKHSFSR